MLLFGKKRNSKPLIRLSFLKFILSHLILLVFIVYVNEAGKGQSLRLFRAVYAICNMTATAPCDYLNWHLNAASVAQVTF